MSMFRMLPDFVNDARRADGIKGLSTIGVTVTYAVSQTVSQTGGPGPDYSYTGSGGYTFNASLTRISMKSALDLKVDRAINEAVGGLSAHSVATINQFAAWISFFRPLGKYVAGDLGWELLGDKNYQFDGGAGSYGPFSSAIGSWSWTDTNGSDAGTYTVRSVVPRVVLRKNRTAEAYAFVIQSNNGTGIVAFGTIPAANRVTDFSALNPKIISPIDFTAVDKTWSLTPPAYSGDAGVSGATVSFTESLTYRLTIS